MLASVESLITLSKYFAWIGYVPSQAVIHVRDEFSVVC